MKQTNDLGREPVGRLLFKLALPAIAAQLINMLYNIVDRIYIGHIPEIGAAALTGVGVTFPIIMLISAFSSLIGMGGAPRAAIRMGATDNDGAEVIIGNCAVALVGISVVLTAFFLLTQEKLLLLFGASADTLPYALSYLNIYVCGTVFVQLALGLNPFITTQGFATKGMLTVLIGAVLNIILDPIFIFGFQMGVRGAALATVLSQAVSAIWVVCFLTGEHSLLRIRRANLRLRAGVLLPVLALGVSPFIMQATESLLNIALNSSLQRYGGDNAVGALTILSSIMMALNMPMVGLSQGAQPIISYNYGAKNAERINKAFRLLLISSLAFSVLVWAVMMTAPRFVASIFTSDAALLDTAAWAARIYMAGTLVMGAQMACQQSFIALGQAKASVFMALLRKVILLIPLIYILPNFFEDQVFAVFLAEPIADVLAAITTCVTFAVVFGRLMKKIETPNHEGEC